MNLILKMENVTEDELRDFSESLKLDENIQLTRSNLLDSSSDIGALIIGISTGYVANFCSWLTSYIISKKYATKVYLEINGKKLEVRCSDLSLNEKALNNLLHKFIKDSTP